MMETINESFKEDLLSILPDAIIWVKPVRDEKSEIIDFQILYSNAHADEGVGHPKGRLAGLQILKDGIPAPDSCQANFDCFLNVYTTGKPHHYSLYARYTNLHFETLRCAFREGVLSTTRDRQKLQEQVALTRQMMNVSLNGVYTLQPVRNERNEIIDFRYLFVNQTIAKLMSLPSDEIIGRRILELIPENKTNGFFHLFCQVLETGESVQDQTYFKSAHIDSWFEYDVVKMTDSMLMITLQDITEQKNTMLLMEQQKSLLEKLVDDLKKSNASLEEFAYAASHDLQAPVRKIRTFSDRIKERLKGKLEEEDLQLFGRMENAADRMKKLIDDLLEFSHVSRGAGMIEAVDLNQKLRVVLEDLEVEIEEKKALITIDPLPTIQGTRRQLQQLFQNLIGNALKYSKPDEVPQIHICSKIVSGDAIPLEIPEKQNGQAFHLIEVQDNGIGFEQQDAERIFNVFTRLHGSSEYKGTGVGLSIVRKIVENHQGYIWAESQPNLGSTFKLLLPVI